MRKEGFVAWSDSLSIGFEEIDGQHQRLIGLINDLWKALMSHSAPTDTATIVSELEDYTRTHFRDEEALMARYGYPALEEHTQSHAFFVLKVHELETRISTGESVGLELLHFLTDWLTFHIRMVDRQYADFISTRLTEPEE